MPTDPTPTKPAKPLDKREGPRVSITARCDGCRFDVAEYYCVEDGNDVDSGFNHYCTHGGGPRKSTGEGRTPPTCPFIDVAIQEAASAR